MKTIAFILTFALVLTLGALSVDAAIVVQVETLYDLDDLSDGTGIPITADQLVFSGEGQFSELVQLQQIEAQFASEVTFDPSTNLLEIDVFIDTRIINLEPGEAIGIGQLTIITSFDPPSDLALVSLTGNLDGNFLGDLTDDGDLLIQVFDSLIEGDPELVVSGTLVFSVATAVPEPSMLLPIAGLSLLCAGRRRKRMIR